MLGAPVHLHEAKSRSGRHATGNKTMMKPNRTIDDTLKQSRNRRFQIHRWSIFVVLSLSYIWVYFHRMAPAVVSDALSQEFAATAASLGALAATYYYISMAMQIPSGVMADRLGTRACIAWGNAIAGFGSILFGLAPNFTLAAAARFLVGLGVSVVFVGFMKSNANWFEERTYGLISGTTLLIGNLGSVLAAAPLATALGVFTWREIFIGIGVFSLGLSALALLVVRNHPEDCGFTSAQEIARQQRTDEALIDWKEGLRDVIATRAIWPGFWFNFAMVGTFYAFIGLWAVPLLQQVYGLTSGEAADYTTLALLGLAFSAVAFGWLSDRRGARKPLMLLSACLYAAVWAMLTLLPWTPGWSAALLFGLMGIGIGGFVLTYPCAKEVCAPALAGMAVSLVNTAVFMGAALIQSVFGGILDLTWDGGFIGDRRLYGAEGYKMAMLFMLCLAIIGVVAATRLRETHCRNISAIQTQPKIVPAE